MHYKNGRVAKVGDKVVGQNGCGGDPFCCIVGAIVVETSSLAIYPLTNGFAAYASNCLHVDDAVSAESPVDIHIGAGIP